MFTGNKWIKGRIMGNVIKYGEGVSRVRNKRNKLICVLMTVFVLVSGMYIEDFKTDSTFMRAPTETTNSCISSVDDFITDAHACTTEMLGIRGNAKAGQSTIRFASQKGDTEISLHFLCQNIFSLTGGKSYACLSQMQFISENQGGLATNYIHKSDGKKRI